MSLFEIKCPMCKGTIWVDPASGKVVDHKTHDHKTADLGEFMQAEKSKTGQWDDKFKKIAEDKEKRKAEIEKQFKAAKENPDSLEGNAENPFLWD